MENTHIINTVKFPLIMCEECGQVFDLTDEAEADEWHFGHDCECE
jgi:Fe2+ or Zn2+ uptake regulation protein